jgi:4-amino-4-deoxy-L-arabinose transferase-like glycosyltransferase
MSRAPAIRRSGWRDAAALAILAALAGVLLVTAMGRLPVVVWDEARLSINAFEMLRTGHLLVPTFHGQADLWNPKPPLATWLAALSMWLFGMSEIALRLPSMLAGIATVAAVYLFTRWASASRTTGLLAGIILLGTGGYVEVHVALTADPDSLLVLFLTIASFALFCAVEERDTARSTRWVFVSAGAFTCALLTKGAAALLILPGYVLGLVALGATARILSRPSTWLAAGLVVLVAGLYWGAAEAAHPGYAAAAWRLDVAGRLTSVAPGFSKPWTYYLVELVRPWQAAPLRGLDDLMYSASAFPWSLAAPILAPVAITRARGRARTATIFCVATLVGLIAALSAAVTRVPWYIAPAYPLLATSTALGAASLSRLLRSSRGAALRTAGAAVMPVAFATALVCIGFVALKTEQEIASTPTSRDERLPSLLRSLPPKLLDNRKVIVISDAQWKEPGSWKSGAASYEPYDGPVEFYVSALRNRGADIRVVRRRVRPLPGELVVGCGLVATADAAVLFRSGDCVAIAPAD